MGCKFPACRVQVGCRLTTLYISLTIDSVGGAVEREPYPENGRAGPRLQSPRRAEEPEKIILCIEKPLNRFAWVAKP